MEVSWFFFAIIATLIWSVGAILVKFVRANYIKSPISYIMLGWPITLLSPILLLFGEFKLPSLKIIIYIFITAITALIGYWLYLKAISKEEVSRIVTLQGLGPLVMLILSTIFLREVLTIKDYLAFPLIIAGSMLISVRRIKDRFRVSKGFILILLSITAFSIHNLFLKFAAEVNFVTMIILRQAWILAIIIITLLSSKIIREKTKQDLKQLNKKKLTIFYIAELCGITGVVFSYLAIQRGAVSLVALVQSTQALFVLGLTILLSIFIPKILKEEVTKKTITFKIVSVLLMMVGLYLIVI